MPTCDNFRFAKQIGATHVVANWVNYFGEDNFRHLTIHTGDDWDRKNGYQGVFVPDHSPQVVCQAPWHASMEFVVVYLRGAIAALESND